MNFLNPKHFSFLQTIKKDFKTILDEYNSIFTKAIPWPDSRLYNKGWDVIGFKYEGQVPTECSNNRILAPKTCELFESLDVDIFTYGFSILRAGCEIKPHYGHNHDVLRSHLCLYTNPDAKLIVGDESKDWVIGDFLVFDDTNLHSAYNKGTTDRVVVLFDFIIK